MAVETNSSLIWDSSNSPSQFHSSSLSNIPHYYDRSLIAPLTLSQRKRNSHASSVQLPPIKLRSTLTWHSSEEEKFLTYSRTSSDQELVIFKKKYDRLRATLSQSLEGNRHALDKAHYKKLNIKQNIDERDELIDQLLVQSLDLNDKVKELKDEIIDQRRKRDDHEMKQLKLHRTIIRLTKTKDKSIDVLKTNDRMKLIEQCKSELLKLKNDQKQELAERDKQIEELKEQLSEGFNHESDDYMKFLQETEQIYAVESQKRDILQEYVDDYETNVYRARKPCCMSTSYRLSKLSTQLRLYLIIELTLHELVHSSCSCGKFKRSYQTFMRLHNK